MLFDMNKTYLNMQDLNQDPPVETNSEIPKEMEIFSQQESEFLPAGKTWNDLTDSERAEIRNKYRFSPYKPGMYQGITGFGNMVG